MSNIPYWIYKISNFLYQKHIPLLPLLFVYINRIVWGAYIPASCQIGSKTKFGYGGSGVVIHARAKIGMRCIINPGVTIGGKSKIFDVPRLGNKVYVGGGAKILGDVEIGDNVIIGANSVVIENVPSNCIVAGIPSKVIKSEINIDDYENI